MIAAVAGTELKIEKNTQLTQGTVGMTLGVQLSEEWNGLSVTAVFSAGGVFRDVAVEGEEITLPWELFVQPGHKLFLSVYGALADGSIVRRTNIASLGEILPSLAPSGNPPEAPTPTRADQIQALAEEALAAAQALREDALSGAFDGADGMSPTASVSKTGDTATITITDASGTTTATVKDGESIDPELIYNAYPARAASGQVIRFDDGAAGIPLKRLRVAIEPVQDLNGYDHPWPAGGGTNQWDEQWESGTIGTSSGVNANDVNKVRSANYIPVQPDTSYFFKAPAGGTAYWYAQDKTFIATKPIAGNAVFTTDASAYYMRFIMGNSVSPVTSIAAGSVAINYPSSVTTYSPYSNIRPITGRTGMTVTRAGKNLIPAALTIDDLYTTYPSGEKFISASSYKSFAVPIPEAAEAITWSKLTGNSVGGYITLSDELPAVNAACEEAITTTNRYAYTYTNPKKKYLVISVPVAYTTSTEILREFLKEAQLCVNVGAVKDYAEPGAEVKLPITWETEAGTVYGGTLDVATGELTVTHVGADLAVLTWQTRYTGTSNKTLSTNLPSAYFGYNRGNSNPFFAEKYTARQSVNGVAALTTPDNYVIGLYWLSNVNNKDTTILYAVVDSSDTPSGLIIYELSEPVTYQLAPQQLSTLLGANTLWADAGACSAEYRADPSAVLAELLARLDG